MSQIVTLNLPDFIYQRIKDRAEQTQRSIEDELLDLVATTMPEDEELPMDLAQAVAALDFLDDKTLWQAARTHLQAKSVSRIETLHDKRRNEGLNDTEEKELASLVKEYEKSILIRSEAMGILMQRGHDVSSIVKNKKA
jgi:plasmid stability protein